MYLLLQTPFSLAALIVRVALGVVMFPHGAQKVLGWFGGVGFKATLTQFHQEMGIPVLLALLAMAAEFLGSMGVIVGFLTRIAAFGIACTVTVAALTVHWQFGFFLNWFGAKRGEWYRVPPPRVRDGALLDRQRRRDAFTRSDHFSRIY